MREHLVPRMIKILYQFRVDFFATLSINSIVILYRTQI